MGERGYYTAPKTHYASNVQRYVDEYRSVWPYEIPSATTGSRAMQAVLLASGAFAGWTIVNYVLGR
jgi:hypothetical protein